MTRKDYVLIAEALRDARGLDDLGLRSVAVSMADRLEEDNPRFDREKFLTYVLTGRW